MDEGYPVLACRRCQLLLLDDSAAVVAANGLPRYGHHANRLGHSLERSVDEQRTRARGLAVSVARLARTHGCRTLLDVGSGLGFLPRACMDAGMTAIGIEPDDVARAYATRENGVPAYRSFDEVRAAGHTTCDLVTLFNVLEHVDDLAGLLGEVRSFMHAGSVAVFRVPNVSLYSALQRLDGLRGRHTSVLQGPPEHRYGFSSNSLRVLLERNGFQDCRYISTPVGTHAPDATRLTHRLLRTIIPMCDDVIRTLTLNRKAGMFGYTIVAARDTRAG
jgi:SAM-dependent methyltransferase